LTKKLMVVDRTNRSTYHKRYRRDRKK